MDGQRFDSVTRLIGAGASRRRVLKGLLGGIAGGAAVVWGREQAAAGCVEEGGDCGDTNSVCCDGLACLTTGGGKFPFACQVPTCAGEGGSCGGGGGGGGGFAVEQAGALECCEGLVCVFDGEVFMCLAPICALEGEECAHPAGEVPLACCDGFVCNSENICEQVPECEVDTDCDACQACVEGFCGWQCGNCEICDPESGDNGTCIFDCTFSKGGPCCDSGETCNEETGVCEPPITCLALGETCDIGQGELSCCDDLTCIDNECVPACAAVGESCGVLQGSEVVCCEGYACNDEGICEEIDVPECEVDDDCVIQAAGDTDAAICCAGVCRQIECCIDDILTGGNPNDRCPEGSTCFEGICVFACKGDSDCGTGTCCCPDGTCSSSCCETGTVTTLPSTGIGDGESNLTGLLGAAAVAGAAALLAGKKLRAADDEA